jgi:ribose transport system substrate-binding protein
MRPHLIIVVLAVLSLLVGACIPAQAPAAEFPTPAPRPEEAEEEMVDTSQYQKDPPWRIAHASQGPTNSWALLYDAHFEWAVNEKHAGLFSEILYADANGNADKQVNDVLDLLVQQPDIMVITALGRAALVGPVEQVMAQGIPVVLCSGLVDTDNFVTFVDRPNYEHGKAQAEWLVERLNGEGKIVTFSGIAGSDTAEERLRAARDVFAEHPGIEILGHAYSDWSISVAKRDAEAFLVAHPQIDGIWSDSAFMAWGATEAFAEAGRPMPPMTAEPLNGFLRLAQEHNVEFYAVGYPPAQSIDCVDAAVKILQGELVAKYTPIGEVLTFTDEELDTYHRPDMSDDLWVDYLLPDEKLEELGFTR